MVLVTIVASGAGPACEWTSEHDVFPDHSLAVDESCFQSGDGNMVDPDPGIGPLSSDFGPTDLHPLLDGSPAIDAGNELECSFIDQRGADRPQGSGCDIGSFEGGVGDAPPPATLRVITQVVNDNGGSLTASGVNVHVRSGGADVAGSPRATSDTTYTLAAGTYPVAADPVAGYALAVGGDCASGGTVTLANAQARTCTVTADDVAVQSSGPPPQEQQPQQEQLPPPEPGKTVNAEPKSGTVTIKLKGTNKFVELQEGEQVPVGSVLDTTKGRVTLVAASNKSGGTATADFYDGIFEIGQTKGAKPITTLKLVEKLACARGKASAAAKRKMKRRLWGDGSGRFRTEGSYSSATVRGTKWLVEDRCTSTLTKVTRGKVAVRDFVKRKTVIVKAGKQYVARARR